MTDFITIGAANNDYYFEPNPGEYFLQFKSTGSYYEAIVTVDVYNVSRGDIFRLGGFFVEVLSVVNNVLTLKYPDDGQMTPPPIVPVPSKLYQALRKREFSPLYDNLMFTWYKELDQSWTLQSAFGVIVDDLAEGLPMPDPYEEFGLFRTLNVVPSTAGINWINGNHKGCDKSCSGGKNLLYSCYFRNDNLKRTLIAFGALATWPAYGAGGVLIGLFMPDVYSSCDTAANGAAEKGRNCSGTYRVCVPDDKNVLAYTFTGLQALSTTVLSSTTGTRQQTGLWTTTNPNHNIAEDVRISTVYTQTAGISLSQSDGFIFPSWSWTRIANQAPSASLSYVLPGTSTAGCNAGYGFYTILDKSVCRLCNAGTYSPAGGHGACQPCTLTHTCPTGSSNDTTLCAAGYYCENTASNVLCPAGYYCPAGTVQPLLCANATVSSTVTAHLSSQITGMGSVRTSVAVSLDTPVSNNWIVSISGFISILKATADFAATVSGTFNLVNPGVVSTAVSGQVAKVQTKALYCPAGSSAVNRCPVGKRCPTPNDWFYCQIGTFCRDTDDSLGVYTGKQCDPNMYYKPPNVAVVQGSIQGASDPTTGTTCYSCPPGYTVDVNQSGCQCPYLYVWSHQQNKCVISCPAGQSLNADGSACVDCPLDTFTNVEGMEACIPCPINFRSRGVNAQGVWTSSGAVGCWCSGIRTSDSSQVLNGGNVTWNQRFNRCEVSCPTGTSVFYSDCFPNTIPATPKPLSTSWCMDPNLYKLIPNGYWTQLNARWFDTNDLDYTYTFRQIGIKEGDTFNKSGVRNVPGLGGYRGLNPIINTGTPIVTNACIAYLVTDNTAYRCKDITLQDCYETPDTDSFGFMTCNDYLSEYCGVQASDYIDIMGACPSPCYTFNDRTEQCDFVVGVQDSSCYVCPDVTVNGTSYPLYNSTANSDGTCSIKGSASLAALCPSIWGNNGALDNLAADAGIPVLLQARLISWVTTIIGGAAVETIAPVRAERYTPTPQSTAIYPGFYLDAGALYRCTGGNYCPGDGKVYDCPAGYYCPGPASVTSCSGTSTCYPGSSTPTKCTASNSCLRNSSSMVTCPAGSYCPDPAQLIGCPAGTYSTATGQISRTTCVTCEAGYYCTGQTNKTQCSAGNYCPIGSTQEKQCPEGFYCSDPSILPRRCPAGVSCPVGTGTDYSRVCSGTTRPNDSFTACISCQIPPNSIYTNSSGCESTRCTGHQEPNGTKTYCVNCTLPAGSIWMNSEGCDSIGCPDGLVPNSSNTKCR